MIKNIESTFLIVNLKPDIDNGIVYDIETFTFLIVNLKLVASCPPASGFIPFTFLIVNLKPDLLFLIFNHKPKFTFLIVNLKQ